MEAEEKYAFLLYDREILSDIQYRDLMGVFTSMETMAGMLGTKRLAQYPLMEAGTDHDCVDFYEYEVFEMDTFKN